jgi:hypothetical protein
MQVKHFVMIGVVGLSALLLGGCTIDESTQTEEQAVEQQQKIFVSGQPAPIFDWSLERHLLVELYTARNNAVNTHSRVRDLNGKIYFECDSIGFPIPANTQLTNPDKIAESYSQGGFAILPQPEPNGLYSSPSSTGTFIFCVNQDGTVSPSYFEAQVEAHAQLKIKTSK